MQKSDADIAMIDKDEVIVPGKLRPKDAATLILVRRDAHEPRILMGRRHGDMAFMAGKFVFPGGRIDPGDQRIAAGGDLQPEVLKKVAAGITPERARGLALAAIRETFEETGVLVGTKAGRTPRTRSPGWRRFFAHGVVPELARLDFIGRAITPPNRTRRFDARFFMADAEAIAHRLEAIDNEELLTPCWVTFDEARALDLPSITRRMMDEAEARLDDAPGTARPAPFFRSWRGKARLDYL
jgi:8-oxo-dGTP pyrophosphatase MutT (NUDIX family)